MNFRRARAVPLNPPMGVPLAGVAIVGGMAGVGSQFDIGTGVRGAGTQDGAEEECQCTDLKPEPRFEARLVEVNAIGGPFWLSYDVGAMANVEHLAKLENGIKSWNAWRHDFLGDVDLSNADLRGKDLTGIDLGIKRNIVGGAGEHVIERRLALVRLDRANLSGANLTSARLIEAQLESAILENCRMVETDFSRANLESADLSRSQILFANLNSTNLKRARMHGVMLRGVAFVNTYMAEAEGLSTCEHTGPSAIDFWTLLKGKLPDSFLRGAGLPEALIDSVRTWNEEDIRFYSCFISYSEKDQEFADRLHDDFQSEGVPCWYARHDMKGGRTVHGQISDAIDSHDKVLLILSQNSIGSDWVKVELKKARKRELRDGGRVLFPIGLSPFSAIEPWECFDRDTVTDLAAWVREYFVPDFSNWKNHDSYQNALARLLRDLKAENTSGERK